MASAAQKITLVTAAPPLRVTALRGQTAPVPNGGGARWNQTARPHRTSLTEYDGTDPFQQQLSLIFDGVDGDVSVESQCEQLERMHMPAADRQEPPLVAVIGAVAHPELDYVINGLDWDTSPMWSPSMYRIRQAVTVTLLQYVADDRIGEAPAAARARQQALAAAATAARKAGGTVSATRTYVVKSGDTLSAIAARLLGSAKRWTDIATLNGIRDPNTIRVGQELRIP